MPVQVSADQLVQKAHATPQAVTKASEHVRHRRIEHHRQNEREPLEPIAESERKQGTRVAPATVAWLKKHYPKEAAVCHKNPFSKTFTCPGSGKKKKARRGRRRQSAGKNAGGSQGADYPDTTAPTGVGRPSIHNAVGTQPIVPEVPHGSWYQPYHPADPNRDALPGWYDPGPSGGIEHHPFEDDGGYEGDAGDQNRGNCCPPEMTREECKRSRRGNWCG